MRVKNTPLIAPSPAANLTESLEQLANAARVGSPRDVERLLEALRPVVARWAIVLTGSADGAEDIAQAVLLQIHRSIESYAPTGKFTAWAYRITRNVAANARRTDQRHQDRIERVTREGVASWLGERGDALDLLGAVSELQRFMSGLSPMQREVLDLVELQGFDAGEVAEMLDISPATVRTHLHRAKSAMRESKRAEDVEEHHE
jgi:RNA polymerase sigma-70 factor, ECF subfamily